MVVLKDIIKIIGQKPGNALNGTLEVHVQNHSFLFTTEKKAKQNVYVMNKMATYSGMKQDGVIGCTHRYQISSWMICRMVDNCFLKCLETGYCDELFLFRALVPTMLGLFPQMTFQRYFVNAGMAISFRPRIMLAS